MMQRANGTTYNISQSQQWFIISSSINTGSDASKKSSKRSKDANGLSGIKRDQLTMY
jgi:hypothetical protein